LIPMISWYLLPPSLTLNLAVVIRVADPPTDGVAVAARAPALTLTLAVAALVAAPPSLAGPLTTLLSGALSAASRAVVPPTDGEAVASRAVALLTDGAVAKRRNKRNHAAALQLVALTKSSVRDPP